MAFFSNEIASILQYFTFPLEVIGPTLATIEVRFPTIAMTITSSIKGFVSSRYEKMSRDHHDEQSAIVIGKEIRSMISQVKQEPEFIPFLLSYRTHKLLQVVFILIEITALAVLFAPMFLEHWSG